MIRIAQNINNIPVYLYQTDKFKTINIRLVFKNHYTKENATKYSLLTSIMTNTSKKYNTKRKVSNALDDLYSANIVLSTSSIHKTRITYINLTLVNEKYIDENILEKGIDLLKEFILNPNIENGIFNQKVYEEEKGLLEKSLKRVFNNKNRYAVKQMLNHMCHDEIVNVDSNGSLDDLDNITNEDIFKTYLDLIHNSEKEVSIIGDVDFDKVTKILKSKILNKLKQSKLELDSNLIANKEVKEVKNIIEHADTNQTQLIMGYRTTIGPLDDDFHALKIFVGMFGGVYSSNLNRVIREELSFTYSIYAYLIGKAKVMYINAGLDPKNCDETIRIIGEELNKYKNGEIDQELLASTKAEMLDGLRSFDDNPGRVLEAFINSNTIYKGIKEFKTINEYIRPIKEGIEKVDLNAIQRVANTIKLDTIYRLQKENI